MRITEVLLLLLATLFAGFAGGCTWQKLADRDDKALAASRVEMANANVDACAVTLQAIQLQGQEDIARADEQVEHAMRAVEQLARENLHMGEALTASEQRMAAAREEPTCREQLEVQLCAAVPLL